jgi:hypothetical protein
VRWGRTSTRTSSTSAFTDPSQYFDDYVDTAIPIPAYGNDAALCAATNSASADWRFKRYGSENIAAVQASGYPAQNNHPGITDSTSAVISSKAYGADSVEVRTGSDFSTYWDEILKQNHILLGSYGSDSHDGVSSGNPANFIDAASLGFEDLMRSYFEAACTWRTEISVGESCSPSTAPLDPTRPDTRFSFRRRICRPRCCW